MAVVLSINYFDSCGWCCVLIFFFFFSMILPPLAFKSLVGGLLNNEIMSFLQVS